MLDVHPVERGDVFGYRGRSAPKSGHIVVVSGGTAHGIGLEAPTGDTSIKARAATLARGGLDAVGFVRSPFTIDGKQRLFAEPPHMQASMLFLPSGAHVPAVGDEVGVRVRFTATTFDRVVAVGPECDQRSRGSGGLGRDVGAPAELAHGVVARPQDVAHHDADEVELAGHPQQDREPVELRVAAVGRGQEVAEVPPHRGEVEDLGRLPDHLVAQPGPGQHRERQQPQHVLRRVDLVDEQEARDHQEAELGQARRGRRGQADDQDADAPGRRRTARTRG